MTNNRMVAAKTIVFKKQAPFQPANYLTVVCAVPYEEHGKTNLYPTKDGRGYFPSSNGTTIYTRSLSKDEGLIRIPLNISLTNYEKNLSCLGWKFFAVVREGKGVDVDIAFKISKAFLSGILSKD